MPLATPFRYNVLGVGVSALTLPQATELILGVKDARHVGYICLGTAHGLIEARKDFSLRRIFNESWLTTPDGMPLVWLAPAGVERVYGPDLMRAVCDAGRAVGLRHYFYGGSAGTAALLAQKLIRLFPGLIVSGTFSPPYRELTDDEFAALRIDIARQRPDVVWVGLGTPKQERFMAKRWRELDAGVLIGVGAAFDFLSGRVRQAPRWMQRSGLEWLFRLATEPGRLGRRYLKTNPLFVLGVLAQRSGLKKFPLDR
jgi:N-acetylglucosaminyldiphosphoundecaprenol N-acetyl-beta-D-mannosaminyltransferase